MVAHCCLNARLQDLYRLSSKYLNTSSTSARPTLSYPHSMFTKVTSSAQVGCFVILFAKGNIFLFYVPGRTTPYYILLRAIQLCLMLLHLISYHVNMVMAALLSSSVSKQMSAMMAHV